MSTQVIYEVTDFGLGIVSVELRENHRFDTPEERVQALIDAANHFQRMTGMEATCNYANYREIAVITCGRGAIMFRHPRKEAHHAS